MKLRLIREKQAAGHLVAMTGDGTNDAPALAQADVAVAMNTGTQAAREAGNMIDLDSNPTKLIEIVEIGKQLLPRPGPPCAHDRPDCVLYPLAVTWLAQTFWPAQASGSLIHRDGTPKGSRLIGQAFTDPGYFWGRLSATSPFPYNAAASGGSNLSALSQTLRASISAALYQAPRVARVRSLDLNSVRGLIQAAITERALGLFGEPVVNVLELNLALDGFGGPRR